LLAFATANEQSAPAVICPGDPGRQQEERRREDRVHHQQQDAQSALSAGTPAVAGKALLKIKDGTPDDKDLLIWKWLKGAATTQMEFGNPLAADDYTLCMYDNGALVTSATAPSGGTCPTCWTNDGNGFSYKNALRTPEGIQKLKLLAGGAGDARILFKGKGVNLRMPDLNTLTGPIDVQLIKTSGGV